MMSEWTGKVEIRTRNKFLAVGKACVAIFRPTPDFKWRTLVSSAFYVEGIFISASAVAVGTAGNRQQKQQSAITSIHIALIHN